MENFMLELEESLAFSVRQDDPQQPPHYCIASDAGSCVSTTSDVVLDDGASSGTGVTDAGSLLIDAHSDPSLQEEDLIANSKHVLVTYSLQPLPERGFLAAAACCAAAASARLRCH
eukprot:CAMPEP_0117477366 /NCGR_PEP_ID=MMETSP0784-20121206/10789_1 /TAXON_ID=39447 /ORGANISM="" /LENGTH=115 /DNA_ID=CAMNT_0005271673 /DNA_START=182 /DNA_END=526 /DNA_ORIENTATION=-